jgi:hypothetical protein
VSRIEKDLNIMTAESAAKWLRCFTGITTIPAFIAGVVSQCWLIQFMQASPSEHVL